MKRAGNVYSNVYSIENLRLAHHFAKKDKSLYKDVKMVDADIDFYLLQIQNILKNKTYRINKNDYTIQFVIEGSKERELRKLKYYPHRIIQRAIMRQLEKMFNSHFCNHVCASIKGKGGRHITELMRKYLKDEEGTKYCLKIDIKKYYASINHKILKSLLRKKIKDKDLLRLLDMIIDSFPGKKGLPIGSYISQYLANFYLSYFDHRLKEDLHCKYVIRYMDDIIILGKTKGKLRVIYRRMKKYLSGKLSLTIKSNRQIFPVNIRGVDYIGYRYFHKYTLLRKQTAIRLKRKYNKITSKINKGIDINFNDWCSINSYSGWLITCDSFRLFGKYIKPLGNIMGTYYYKHIKNNLNKTNKYTLKLMDKQYAYI